MAIVSYMLAVLVSLGFGCSLVYASSTGQWSACDMAIVSYFLVVLVSRDIAVVSHTLEVLVSLLYGCRLVHASSAGQSMTWLF